LGEVNQVSRTPRVDTEDILCVLQAYGPSTYELEEMLFQKYLLVCRSRKGAELEQASRDKFQYLLHDLSALGYVKLISRGDKLYWMRLRSVLELEEGSELTPEKAAKLIEGARATREAKRAEEQRGSWKEDREIPKKPSVGEMADMIISELVKEYDPEKLRTYMVKGEPDDVRRPIKEMHEALISGVDEFRLYIEKSFQGKLKGQLTYFLASAGRDALLAALAVSLMIPLRVVAPKQVEAPSPKIVDVEEDD
jgi:hypothetical protein